MRKPASRYERPAEAADCLANALRHFVLTIAAEDARLAMRALVGTHDWINATMIQRGSAERDRRIVLALLSSLSDTILADEG